MDDYMREMVDLKTIVTKTLEKKGVLARIRAELRANVFQAMEEQDHEAESNGSTTFSLLGTCNERSKKLHNTSSGRLLMALVCEYMEWCELDHTLKVYMPELNQPRTYNRNELEEVLGLVGEPKPDSNDSQPLLLTIMESFLKEKMDLSVPGSLNQVKTTGQGSANDGTIRPAQPLLADLPQHRRGSGVPAFSGVSRSASTARGSSNGSANDQQSAVPVIDPRVSRDRDSDGKRREYSWREEDELHSGMSMKQKQECTWRDQDYDTPHMNSPPRTEKEGGNDQIGDHSTSQTRRTTAIDSSSKALGKLHLDELPEFGSRQSAGARATPQSQAPPRDSTPSAVSAGSKNQASAYFYSDSEEENAPE